MKDLEADEEIEILLRGELNDCPKEKGRQLGEMPNCSDPKHQNWPSKERGDNGKREQVGNCVLITAGLL